MEKMSYLRRWSDFKPSSTCFLCLEPIKNKNWVRKYFTRLQINGIQVHVKLESMNLRIPEFERATSIHLQTQKRSSPICDSILMWNQICINLVHQNKVQHEYGYFSNISEQILIKNITKGVKFVLNMWFSCSLYITKKLNYNSILF